MAKSTGKTKRKKLSPKRKTVKRSGPSAPPERSDFAEVVKFTNNLVQLHKIQGTILNHLEKRLAQMKK